MVVHASALLGLNILIFAGVYFSTDSFPGDFSVQYYTLPAFWIASVTAGEWPAWIPYVGMGMPLGSIPQSSILYPPLWVFPALHLPYTLKAASVLNTLHVFAGALGSYVLVRRLFGSPGVAFVAAAAYLVYGGFYVNAQHPDIVRGFALLPWLLWALFLTPERLRPVRVGTCAWQSALSAANLVLPALVLLFVTGAYPGDIQAFVCVLPVFLGLQLLRNHRDGQPVGAAALDAAVLSALLVLGGLLASAFLLPLISSSDELTRTGGPTLSVSSLIYLRLRDLYGLVLSSNVVRPELHRDIGMQLPLVLFPFAAFLRGRGAWLLLPFFGVAALALIMALDVTSDVSQALIRLIPTLGYSRFPAGDYRTICALTVLLALACGLREAVRGREEGRTLGAVYLIGLGGLALVVVSSFFVARIEVPPDSTDGARDVLLRQSIPAIVLAIVLLIGPRRVGLPGLPSLVAGLCILSAWPVLEDMREDWQVKDAERWLLNDANMKIWDGDTWRVDQVVRERLFARPPRHVTRKYPTDVLWNAYLNGQFFTTDDNGAILQARRRVQRQPELLAYMSEGTRLVAVPCSAGVCESGSATQVPLAALKAAAAPGFSWQPVTYLRSTVQYHVQLAEPALVIENELYARGWQASIDDAQAPPPVRVNEALRGWVVPAGEHQLDLSFRTPGLEFGVAGSAAALMVYASLLAYVTHRWALTSRSSKCHKITTTTG